MTLPLQPESLCHFSVAERRLILPDTSLDLAWVDERIDVIGPMSKARPTRYPVGTHVVLLSINPIVASRWLRTPLHLLTDRVVDLRDLNLALAEELAREFDAGTISRLLQSTDGRNDRACSRGEVATAYLQRGARVGRVAEIVNLSERQLTRYFRSTTGLHPKRYQRIFRLRQAIMAAKAGHGLAAAAANAGFADQAHLSREVRALTGSATREILSDVGNIQDIDRPLG